MSGFDFVRASEVTFPMLKLTGKTKSTIGKLIVAGILDNILKQQQTDGARIKINAKSTRERKQREGKPMLSLIDKKHRFIQGGLGSFKYRMKRDDDYLPIWRVIPSTPELRKINKYVQEMGYTGWFGLRYETKQALKMALRQFVVDAFAKATRESGRRRR